MDIYGKCFEMYKKGFEIVGFCKKKKHGGRVGRHKKHIFAIFYINFLDFFQVFLDSLGFLIGLISNVIIKVT